MGYSDIGCYGSEIATPSLDSLAKNGVRFTRVKETLTGHIEVDVQRRPSLGRHAAVLLADPAPPPAPEIIPEPPIARTPRTEPLPPSGDAAAVTAFRCARWRQGRLRGAVRDRPPGNGQNEVPFAMPVKTGVQSLCRLLDPVGDKHCL